jgi:hypothetical protein
LAKREALQRHVKGTSAITASLAAGPCAQISSDIPLSSQVISWDDTVLEQKQDNMTITKRFNIKKGLYTF